MTIQYDTVVGLPDEPILTSLIDLLSFVFNDPDRGSLRAKLEEQASRTGLQTQLALVDQKVVGCKLGYERKAKQFYSWLGGVHVEYRGRRIATELMQQQHEWCRQKGYHTVRTQTYNQWRAMLMLNIRSGYDIIGTLQGKRGLIIVLEKKL